jgi:hypothetical protein
MRNVTKKRLIWVGFVVIFVWLLAFLLTRFFLPEIVEVSEFVSVQTIRKMVGSWVAIGTVITFGVLIIGAIIIDNFSGRRN